MGSGLMGHLARMQTLSYLPLPEGFFDVIILMFTLQASPNVLQFYVDFWAFCERDIFSLRIG